MFFQKLFTAVSNYPVDQMVIDNATLLRQKKNLGLGTALIAATCLLFDEEVLTANTDDFKNIQGLKVVNPLK